MNRGVRQLRIVGGSLRGRKITFPDEPGLRPTPDRVRETLFNWLAPHIAGMRVLDLFAGSGALGFEALSRGAAEVTLVDASRVVGSRLRETAAAFGLAQARVEVSDATEFLRHSTVPWDLIFVDPPFAENLVPLVLKSISGRHLLAPGGFCYVEIPQHQALPPLPADWALHREGKAGEVGYHLLHETRRALPRDL